MPDSEDHLKPGISFEILDTIALQITDNQATDQLQGARRLLFNTIHGRTLLTGWPTPFPLLCSASSIDWKILPFGPFLAYSENPPLNLDLGASLMLKLVHPATTTKILATLLFAVFLACDGEQSTRSPRPNLPPLEIQTQVFLSDSYLVNQIYRSMKGPQNSDDIQIGGDGPPEPIWILSYKTEIVDPATGDVISEEFMCHNSLNFEDLKDHLRKLGTKRMGRPSERLFTLSQGAMSVEFPEGFGVPMMSNERLRIATQILNLNPVDQIREVQYRTTVRYARDKDVMGRLQPLYQRGLQGLKLISGVDGYFGIEPGDTEGHGESCSIGVLAGKRTISDKYGRSFAAHWVVAPGLEENHTLVTEMLALRQDTTAHYVAVHLHPFAKSLELRDLTTGRSVFRSMATNRLGRVGLERVEYFSSENGFPLYKDHEYTLVSVYDNTSGEPQDAMAVMFIYMLDKNYQKKLLVN